MYDLVDKIQVMSAQLDQALRTLRSNGNALAEAERIYKEAVSKEALRLKDEGMAVTMMDKVIYGLPSISTFRYQRDCAKVLYDANQEAINVRKLQIRLVEAQLSREWGNSERNI